jgi:hypothetical protein
VTLADRTGARHGYETVTEALREARFRRMRKGRTGARHGYETGTSVLREQHGVREARPRFLRPFAEVEVREDA